MVSTQLREGQVHLGVRDEGPGVSEAECDKMFQPFTRASAQPTGGEKSTGLGLAITRKIVEGHQGKIWVESRLGHGSTFWVRLPAFAEEPAAITVANPSASGVSP